jgi:DeoR family fructose operon transcriptional repressor
LEKQAIDKKAFSLVNEGETIALDSGTTTLQLAKLLTKKKNITVLTNSLHAILELYGCRDIKVISTAGFLSNATYSGEGKGDPCFVGPLAEETLKRFRPSKAFIGTSGLTLTDGISNSVIDEATMKRAMIDVSSEVILLADHSKLGHVAASIVGPVTLIDSLITDNQITKEFEDSLTEMGVNVIKVKPEESLNSVNL